MKQGNLEGDSAGYLRESWEFRPQSLLICPPESHFKIPRFHCPTPGLFHTLDIYTMPYEALATKGGILEFADGIGFTAFSLKLKPAG